MMNLLLFVILLFVGQVFSKTVKNELEFIFPKDREPPHYKIINGNEATPHSIPEQVALDIMLKDNNSSFCSGTLISNTMVLTAAHCLENAATATLKFGYHKLDEGTDDDHYTTTSTDFIIHPKYAHYNNDIAIISLDKNVPLNDNIKIANLYGGNSSRAGDDAVASGWGATSTNGTEENALRYVESTVMSNEDCKATSSDYEGVITDQHLCLSGENNVGTCAGDSGGPLRVDGVQIGVVSFGYKVCEQGLPSVFTRLSEYRDWIEENCKDCNGAEDIRSWSLLMLAISLVLINL